jgi:PIN domain nuclease of toxin-antitoxin system
MTTLLDTCALLDLAAGRWKNEAAKEVLRESPDATVLSVSVWEIARKFRLGKLTLPCDQKGILEFVRAVCRRYDLRLVSLSPEICQEAELLPPHHEDPFDRMIIAAARLARADLFTSDPQFSVYPVRIIAHR